MTATSLLIGQGAWFSVGPSMVASEKGRQLIEEMPISQILLETDGPFATKRDGTPWFPWEAEKAAQTLCDIWGMTIDEVREQLRINLRTILPTSLKAFGD